MWQEEGHVLDGAVDEMNSTNSTNTTVAAMLPDEGFNPAPLNIALASLVAVLIILALGGNFIVCASFFTFRDLRTKCNYFIISLAVSDILVGLVAMPFWFTLQLTDNKWKLSQALRRLWDMMDILCGSASIINLTAVSFDRQLAITAPFSYPEVMTSRRALCLIGVVWSYAAIVAGLRFIDAPHWPGPGYLYFVPVVSFFLPLIVMLVMYARIYLVARYQAKRIGRNYATDIKAAKTIAVVIGVFFICWCPFFVTVLAFALGAKGSVWIQVLNWAKWLEYLNSCLNPIIYTCLNRAYRRAFRKLFLRCRSKIMRGHFAAGDTTWGSVAESRAPTLMSSAAHSSPPASPRNNNTPSGHLLAEEKVRVTEL